MRALPVLLSALLVIGAAPPPAGAADVAIAGKTFPDRLTIAGAPLVLTNGTLFEYRWFDVYVAALYLGEGVQPAQVLDDVAKRIEFRYLRELKGDDFRKATSRTIATNIDAAALARIRPQVDQLNAAYQTVRDGDIYALTYVPGVGTELALNGAVKATLPGAEFAQALFRIWFGDQPMDKGLKRKLVEPRKAE